MKPLAIMHSYVDTYEVTGLSGVCGFANNGN